MTPTNETTVQISIPSSAPAALLQRVRSLATDLAAIAGISVELAEIRSCQKCGCTDEKGCMFGCSWVSDSEDLCTACAPHPPTLPFNYSHAIMRLHAYAVAADLTATDDHGEDIYLALQESIENNSSFYISVDELREAFHALSRFDLEQAHTNDEDAYLLLQEHLELTSSFHIPVDEIRATVHDLHRRGWALFNHEIRRQR